MRREEKIVRAARALIGVPFRLHGRDAASGVDCIGLAVLALRGAGHRGLSAPNGYSVRGGSLQRFAAVIRCAGLRPVRKGRPGDVVLVRAAVEQFHLMIATGEGHVHAHAGLGRVVEMPGASPWRPIARFRWGR